MKTWLLIFSLLIGQATYAQVIIKPETAQFFLEVLDERNILMKKDSLQKILIKNQALELLTKNQIIVTYQKDAVVHARESQLLTKELEESDYIIDDLHDELKKRTFFEIIGAIGAILLIIFL